VDPVDPDPNSDPDPQHCFLAPELSTTAIVNDKGENILITVIINCLRDPFYEQSVKKLSHEYHTRLNLVNEKIVLTKILFVISIFDEAKSLKWGTSTVVFS
jgi:hypothetical protein